ncbi:MAG TPA: hypothetical protein VIK74_03595, partial [Parasegetibacter sp.]
MLLRKRLFQLLMVPAVALTVVSCKKNNDIEEIIDPPGSTVLNGTLNADRTLTADQVWTLKGYVFVPDGVTLTIEPGTTVVSDVSDKGALCIERGGKIIAEGTADKPIVFTSGKPVGSRSRGDWGGIVILGKATTNRTSTPVIEGGLDRLYGGTDDDDNSGVLKYVRIEYAGIAAFSNSEINALTLGAVGRGTTIENVQVAYANDDAFEFFGGTVNAKYLISFATSDDDFDFDFGYRGKIQFAVALRDPSIEDTDAGNGVESDNDGSGSNAEPFTRPELSNFTWVGPNQSSPNGFLNYGNRWRRSTRFSVRNSIIMGWPKGGFSIESDETATALKTGLSEFRNNIVQASTDIFRSNSNILNSADLETKALEDGCLKFTNAAEINLTDPFNRSNPNMLPAPGSPALSGADFTGIDSYFTTTDYIGAFG